MVVILSTRQPNILARAVSLVLWARNTLVVVVTIIYVIYATVRVLDIAVEMPVRIITALQVRFTEKLYSRTVKVELIFGYNEMLTIQNECSVRYD